MSNALIELDKKITDQKNTLQNCKLFVKTVEVSPLNVLLKMELEENNEINTSQMTKNTSVYVTRKW